jgi:HSP20 family protein
MTYYQTPNYRTFNRFVNRVLNDAIRSQQFAGEQLDIAVDVQETSVDYWVTANVPGLQATDVKLEVQENQMTLNGSVQAKPEVEGSQYLLRERHFGNFKRVFQFPKALDAAQVTANLADGVLTIQLPKAVEARPKTIEVKVQA